VLSSPVAESLDEVKVPELRRENADERHIIAKGRGAPTPCLSHEQGDTIRIEVAVLA
jgi:hypothetical protein